MLYEAGEGLRFDENAVRTGVVGILRVMRQMGMIAGSSVTMPKTRSLHSSSSNWLRAPAGGLLRTFKTIGAIVESGEQLGIVSDPFGEKETEVTALSAGLIVGRASLPVVNEGDALFHIADLQHRDPQATLDSLAAELDAATLIDEDEII